MSDRQKELYKLVRYALETSVEPFDVGHAVSLLDDLVKQVKIDTVKAVVDRLTDGIID